MYENLVVCSDDEGYVDGMIFCVSQQVFSKTVIGMFLTFCMKVVHQKTSKRTQRFLQKIRYFGL